MSFNLNALLYSEIPWGDTLQRIQHGSTGRFAVVLLFNQCQGCRRAMRHLPGALSYQMQPSLSFHVRVGMAAEIAIVPLLSTRLLCATEHCRQNGRRRVNDSNSSRPVDCGDRGWIQSRSGSNRRDCSSRSIVRRDHQPCLRPTRCKPRTAPVCITELCPINVDKACIAAYLVV
jgi:hypothetical protein